MKYIFSVIFFLFVKCALGVVTNDTLLLFQSAYLLRVDSSEIFKAKVPGSIYTDLFRNKKIPDPFYGDNEKNLKWIEKENWVYIDTFSLSQEKLSAEKIELLLEGVDTYADVFLNGEKLLSCDNMFISYKVDVKKFCRERNILKIQLKPVDQIADSIAGKYGVKLPGGNRVFVRKAAFNFGWDFAPDLRAGGICKPVKLIFSKPVSIDNIHFQQKSLSEKVAEAKFEVVLNSDKPENAIVKLVSSEGNIDEIKYCEFKAGKNIVSFDVKIFDPKRWSTNGNTESYLYNFKCSVSSGEFSFDKSEFTVGFRTLKLVQQKDLSGESFYFLLNDTKIFCKGANVVPPDYFTGNATDSSWIALVKKAAELNMNMLRVWGGGVYPPESFYDACDKYGILVWQDFMFACAMYPGDSLFLKSVAEESEQAILKFRNHPSLALWCGNNENIEGWYNWGWQKEFQYSQTDSLKIINDYNKLFEKLLSEQVAKFDGATGYWPSSPSIGWGRKESMLKGDSHYWGGWWGMEPFEIYKEKVPRFMSEYGFQSLPAHSTISKFAGSAVNNFSNTLLKNHQKHPTGFETIDKYLTQYYNSPKDFRSKIYLSGLLQAKAMDIAVTAHRSRMPYCMGSLIWQLNDCWPGISWSLFDYYGKNKSAAYQVKKDFRKVIVTAELNEKDLSVKIVSDSSVSFPGDLTISLIDFDGNVRWSDRIDVIVRSDSAVKAYSKNLKFLRNLYDDNSAFLLVELSYEEKHITSKVICFVKESDLKLKRPSVSMKRIELPENHYRFEISVNCFAKNVELSIKDDSNGFSDNFFDMVPDRKYYIDYFSGELLAPNDGLNIRSMVDTY